MAREPLSEQTSYGAAAMKWVIHMDVRDPATLSRAEVVLTQLGDWVSPLPGFYILKAPFAAVQIRTVLAPELGPEDGLIFVSTGTEALVHRVRPETIEWLDEEFPAHLTERTRVA
jgi:hypothetical protein